MKRKNESGIRETSAVIDAFDATVRQYAHQPKSNAAATILKKIQDVAGHRPSLFGEQDVTRYLQERSRFVQEAAHQYVRAIMSEHFPRMSNALFTLQRRLYLEQQQGSYTVVKDLALLEGKLDADNAQEFVQLNAQLFPYIPLFQGDTQEEVVLGFVEKTKGRRTALYDDTLRQKTWITARFPGLQDKVVKDVAQKAKSTYFSILAEALEHPIIGEVLLSVEIAPQFGAVWIPTLDSLNVHTTEQVIERRVRDPALLLRTQDDHYLVTTWNVGNEEPFEHYLSEFKE